MAIFGSARQRFLDRFEPRAGGFAYRQTLYGRAVLVTAEERAWIIQDYEDWRMIFWIMLPADLPLTIVVTMLAYKVNPSPAVYPAVAWLTFLSFPGLLALWAGSGRWRLLRGRPYVDEGLPREEVARRERAQTSWAGLLSRLLLAILWSSTNVLSTDLSPIWRAFSGALGVAAFVIIFREGCAKLRHEPRSDPGGMGR